MSLGRKLIRALNPKHGWQEALEDLKDLLWYDPISWYRSKYEMLQRVVFWGWKMRWSWDFDAHTIYEMLYLKLDRVYVCMRDHSHCVWNSNEDNRRMRELREAKELARRLMDDDYEMAGFYETEEKYGKLKTWTTKIPDKPLYRYHSLWGEDEKTDKEAGKLFTRRNKHWNDVRKLHKDRLFYLLNNNIDGWWD